MKYKVGDKVRVRKDLEVWKNYGGYDFADSMKKMRGNIFTIRNKLIDCYEIKEIDFILLTDEMLEPVEDIIEYKGKKYEFIDKVQDIETNEFVYMLKEHKEEILDEAEKRYLRNVIKYVIEPTHNEVHCITKHKDYDGYMININFENNDGLSLPYFKDKRMYKGMELDKEYTLEDLNLWI